LAHYVLATALSGNDREADALAEYRRASELEPRNPTYLDHLAVSLDLNGDTDGALTELNKAIALDPSSPEYQFNLGVVLESRRDFAGAIEPLRRSAELSHGRNWRSYAELAKACDKAGQHAEAIRAARQAMDVASQARDEQAAHTLREALAEFQRHAASASP